MVSVSGRPPTPRSRSMKCRIPARRRTDQVFGVETVWKETAAYPVVADLFCGSGVWRHDSIWPVGQGSETEMGTLPGRRHRRSREAGAQPSGRPRLPDPGPAAAIRPIPASGLLTCREAGRRTHLVGGSLHKLVSCIFVDANEHEVQDRHSRWGAAGLWSKRRFMRSQQG